MRWSIVTPNGNIWVYYGDLSSTFQAGTDEQSGANLMTTGEARFEGYGSFAAPPGGQEYTTLADMLTRGDGASEPVTEIDLVTDAGYAGEQQVQLHGVSIGTQAGTSTYVPGTVPGSTSSTTSTGPYVQDNSAPAWVYLNEVNGATPGQAVDEALVDTQGDSGGQFRQVDGMYMYNFPVSNLKDPTATYQIGISFHSDGSSPVGVVKFGTK